jgi:hypothetical protein
MNRFLLWFVIAAFLLVGVLLYRSQHRAKLNLEPDAREEIEKAKRR